MLFPTPYYIEASITYHIDTIGSDVRDIVKLIHLLVESKHSILYYISGFRITSHH